MLVFWGFDWADPGDEGWTGIFSRSTTHKRNGTHSLEFGGNAAATPSFGNEATLYAGFAYRMGALSGSVHRICGFYDGGTTDQITLTRETDGSIAVRRGNSSGTIVAQSAAGVLNTAAVWVHLQVRITFHGSTGAVEVRREGATVASASGVNTSSTGNAYASIFWVAGPSGTGTAWADDVWVSDSAFQGDCKVECLHPTADGNTNNWTATGETERYQCVDDAAANDGDTSYVTANTLDDKQLFEMGNLISTVGTIKGGKFSHVSRKDDAGSRNLVGVVRSGGSDYDQSDNAQSETYAVYTDYLEQDPATTAAWTISGANAVEYGVKISA